MVLFHIMGSGQAFSWGGLSWTLDAGPAATDVGLARKRMFPRAKPIKTYASETPARQAPMIHGIQLWLCSGRSSVRFGGFAYFGVADVPSLSAALTGGRNDSLASWSCSSSRFCRAACGLSSVCLLSVIDDSRASMSKLTVLNCGQCCRQRSSKTCHNDGIARRRHC